MNISRSEQIANLIEEAMGHVAKQIACLHSLPSGFRIHEISSLTLVTSPMSDFRYKTTQSSI